MPGNLHMSCSAGDPGGLHHRRPALEVRAALRRGGLARRGERGTGAGAGAGGGRRGQSGRGVLEKVKTHGIFVDLYVLEGEIYVDL